MNGKVYILIINFNKYFDTIECIESIIKNSYKNFRLVVIDNNSSNDSIEQLLNWTKNKKLSVIKYNSTELKNINKDKIKKYKKIYDPLIFISSDINNGFSAGNNIGIKYGQLMGDADFFWLLNNDTIIKQYTLTELINTADDNKKNGIIGSKLLYHHNPEIVQSLGNDKVSWKGIGHGSYDGIPDTPDLINTIEMKSIVGASLLIKKDVVDKIGLMDETYFLQHEESDWCLKAMRQGYRLLTNCKSVVLHKEGASSERERTVKSFFGRKISRTTITDFLMWGYYSFRNEIYFVKKNYHNYFLLYILIILPPKFFLKIALIILFDDYKISRISLMFRALIDGITGRSGKRIDPLVWRKKFI